MISAVDSSLTSGSSIGSWADRSSSYAVCSSDSPMTTTVPIDAAAGTDLSSGSSCASTTMADGAQSVRM